MASELDKLPPGGAAEGLYLNPKGMATREYNNARREVKFDVEHTALLCLHLQKSTVEINGVTEEMLDRIASVQAGARRAGIHVVHQMNVYRKGYPEASPRSRTLRGLKTTGLLQPGLESAEIHPKVAPQQGEIVVTGRRVSAFSENDMGLVLRAKDITALVIMGTTTGGSILATMASATDLDYQITILEDCCMDRDPELHHALVRLLFPRRTTVMTSQEFRQVIGAV